MDLEGNESITIPNLHDNLIFLSRRCLRKHKKKEKKITNVNHFGKSFETIVIIFEIFRTI